MFGKDFKYLKPLKEIQNFKISKITLMCMIENVLKNFFQKYIYFYT